MGWCSRSEAGTARSERIKPSPQAPVAALKRRSHAAERLVAVLEAWIAALKARIAAAEARIAAAGRTAPSPEAPPPASKRHGQAAERCITRSESRVARSESRVARSESSTFGPRIGAPGSKIRLRGPSWGPSRCDFCLRGPEANSNLPSQPMNRPLRHALVPFVLGALLFFTAGAARADVPATYKGKPFDPAVAGGAGKIPPTVVAGPYPIPGRIDIINYDLGGDGVGYHAGDHITNNGSESVKLALGYRTDAPTATLCLTNQQENDVWYDTGTSLDGTFFPSPTTADYYIGAVQVGDYFNFTVNVATAGTYVLSSTWASGNGPPGGEGGDGAMGLQVFSNGTMVGSWTATFPGYETEANFHNWKAYPNFATVTLAAGLQVIKLQSASKHLNTSYVQFDLLTADGGIDDGDGSAGGTSGAGGSDAASGSSGGSGSMAASGSVATSGTPAGSGSVAAAGGASGSSPSTSGDVTTSGSVGGTSGASGTGAATSGGGTVGSATGGVVAGGGGPSGKGGSSCAMAPGPTVGAGAFGLILASAFLARLRRRARAL